MKESLPNVGRRIKALRQERGLTLQQVSDRGGVSVSTLSKIENGQASGTVNTMLKIARGLGVLFDSLLEHEPDARAPTARLVRTSADEVKTFPTEFYNYHVHSSELVGRQMLPLIIDVKAREAPPRIDWSTHPGEEFLLVLEGRVELHTEHYAPITLQPGDSVYFDSLMRHAYVSVGECDARVVSVSLAQDSATSAKPLPAQRSAAQSQSSSVDPAHDPGASAGSAQDPTSKSSNPFGGGPNHEP